MKKIGILLLSFICCLFITTFSANALTKSDVIRTTVQQTSAPVNEAVKNEYWVETRGNLNITMPSIPEAGLANPEVTITGMGQTLKHTMAWGVVWSVKNLAAGFYTITASNVSIGQHTYQANRVNTTLEANNTAPVVVKYTLAPSSAGNLTITIPDAPVNGLNNPVITVQGMGKTFNQIVPWGTQWQLTDLAAGNYTVTSSTVTDTDTYQANPVEITVAESETLQAEMKYTLVAANSTTALLPAYTPENNNRPISWNKIKHIVIIVFENSGSEDALEQPFFKSLTTKGAYLSNYSAVSHPSQPNYLALIGGCTFGVIGDGNHNINAKHIGNLLNAKGLTWKSYAEGYPGNCFQGANSGTYYRKHEPFISFVNVQSNAGECAKVVPGQQFFSDLAANKLPKYSLYIPDINNDGHDTGVAFADKYFSKTFGPIFNNASVMNNTLFIITFDEDDNIFTNKVYTAFVGAGVKAGATSALKYNHYSILKTVEDILQLGTLGRKDQKAAEILDIWDAVS
ncbi:alkaline phosphatase family protein [Legionella sp. D16C41]|uniref:alkaline phosphatase family protein n=1 Tax=Legionella sp. D16C41 TaxID=3402688 RepID=UPI003AF8BA09